MEDDSMEPTGIAGRRRSEEGRRARSDGFGTAADGRRPPAAAKFPSSGRALPVGLAALLPFWFGTGPAATAAGPAGPDDPAAAVPADVEIREWEVPWAESRPRDPYVAPDDRVWFVGQRSDYIAVLDPATGEFERFDLDPGTGPHNLIVDDDGIVWYAGNRAAHIGRLDPANGEITKYPMPDSRARDPHTLVFGPAGEIWFTVQAGNFVGRLRPSSGKIDLVPVPTAGARPYGIVVTPEGRPWIALLGTNKLASVDPESMELAEHELTRPEARPRRLGLTSDGRVWYVDYARGYLGSFDSGTAEFRERLSPGGHDSRPYGMAVDGKDRIWFVETGPSPNRLVGFNPHTDGFFGVTEIPSGGGTVRHMYADAEDGEIWFGTDTNTIGRAIVP